MVLERRHHDLVATRDVPASPARGNEVYGFGGSASEDQTVGVAGTEESGYALPGGVIALRRMYREGIGAAMRIGVAGLVEIPESIQHLCGFLRGCRRIQIMQARICLQQRKIGSAIHSETDG